MGSQREATYLSTTPRPEKYVTTGTCQDIIFRKHVPEIWKSNQYRRDLTCTASRMLRRMLRSTSAQRSPMTTLLGADGQRSTNGVATLPLPPLTSSSNGRLCHLQSLRVVAVPLFHAPDPDPDPALLCAASIRRSRPPFPKG